MKIKPSDMFLGVSLAALAGYVDTAGFVGLCGAMVAQYQGFADIGMGIGLILVGLASVIIGQAIFASKGLDAQLSSWRMLSVRTESPGPSASTTVKA